MFSYVDTLHSSLHHSDILPPQFYILEAWKLFTDIILPLLWLLANKQLALLLYYLCITALLWSVMNNINSFLALVETLWKLTDKNCLYILEAIMKNSLFRLSASIYLNSFQFMVNSTQSFFSNWIDGGRESWNLWAQFCRISSPFCLYWSVITIGSYSIMILPTPYHTRYVRYYCHMSKCH